MAGPTDALRRSAGVSRDPFRVYLEFRDSLAATVPAADTIYLELRGRDFASIKGRELLTYFLHDRALAGDWSADPGLLPELLSEEDRHVPAERSAWIVRMLPEGEFVVQPNHSARTGP